MKVNLALVAGEGMAAHQRRGQWISCGGKEKKRR
uniref:Uncharacterized protein n=1 Tax=Arundo donax TaxID=35708 RepID=A0A0A9AAB9_ARUDO